MSSSLHFVKIALASYRFTTDSLFLDLSLGCPCLVTYCTLFFIEIANRRVYIAETTTNPTSVGWSKWHGT